MTGGPNHIVTPRPTPPGSVTSTPQYGPRFWVGVAIGWSIIGFGIHSAYVTKIASRPVYTVKLLILFALVHDLVVAPVIIALGLAMRRVLRGGIIVRVAVGAAIVSVVVTAYTWPEIRGYGRTPSLQSLQLGNYATGLLTVLGTVWGVAAVIATARVLLARRRRSAPPSEPVTVAGTASGADGERRPVGAVAGVDGLKQSEPAEGSLGSEGTDPAGR